MAPDVLGDAEATWQRSRPWLGLVRELAIPAALLAQNGADDHAPMWDNAPEWDVGSEASQQNQAASSKEAPWEKQPLSAGTSGSPPLGRPDRIRAGA